jgi:alkylated DNA repair dioxygenase AlkB
MEGITYKPNFLANHTELFENLKNDIVWDMSMKSRMTASFGKPYDYSQISYNETLIPSIFHRIIWDVSKEVGFEPNNILLNYYHDEKSRMGYHSDRTDILAENCGVAIISLGDVRELRFRSKQEVTYKTGYVLESGSLFYMTQEIQKDWEHALINQTADQILDHIMYIGTKPFYPFKIGRISITLRKIK